MIVLVGIFVFVVSRLGVVVIIVIVLLISIVVSPRTSLVVICVLFWKIHEAKLLIEGWAFCVVVVNHPRFDTGLDLAEGSASDCRAISNVGDDRAKSLLVKLGT